VDKKDRGKGSKIRHRCQLKDAGHHFEEEEGEKDTHIVALRYFLK